MSKIEHVPRADRRAVLALEMNTVIPDSISAEDWLRGKRQFYIVSAYVITLLAVLIVVTLAYINRGGLVIDSVQIKTRRSGFIEPALADPVSTPIQSFQQRHDGTKHEYKFDLIMRNTSDKPINVTNVVVTFDPDEPGFLSEALEISNTYAVLLNEDGLGKVDSKSGEASAYAWYPNEDGHVLVVKTPLQQTMPPLTTDRFVVDIRFPEDYAFRGPMQKAMLSLIWNGNQKIETQVSLTP